MRELAALARFVWRPLLVLVLLELVGAVLAVLTPIPLQTALDVLVQHRPAPAWLSPFFPHALVWLCVGSLMLTVLSQAEGLAGGVLSTGIGQRLIRRLRAQLFAAALRLSLQRHIERGTADVLYRIQSDAQAAEWFLLDGALPVLSALVTLAAMLTALFRLNPLLGAIGVGLAPFLLFTARLTRPSLKAAAREARQKESEALGIVQTSLGAVTTIKAFGIEDTQTARFAAIAEEAVKIRLRIALLDGLFGSGVQILCALGTVSALYVGIDAAQRGTLTVGQVLLGLHYLDKVYGPLKTLGKKWASLQTQLVGLERALVLLNEPPEVLESATTQALTRAKGGLTFEGISFGYDPRRPVLRGVSLAIAPGERVGIVGETGSGKSTLLSLLLRFYDPTEGEVRLDGLPVTTYTLADLRRQLAVVFQETVLLPGTIAENIAVGQADATPEQIEAAARAARLHEAVQRFPDGYQTRVGERGAALSGGERQRVGLARAFLRDAPILLLDEPTSALDTTTETEVLAALERLMEGRTVVIVTHRESALRGVNRVFSVVEGQLAERGATPVAAAET